ncbi:carboxylesterase [Aureobasidium pullulans]|uniref:Carboxylic ester hydrolase n=1 Tax=Aureobasidium pullulans TaxID=5580 RepID=A0A4S8ZRE7_AURPU|nr:carboxylesterase [Aureobasidium pullulans]THW77955.1 carboxylesterase [Aureobasidium pullulans]THY59846.1 carboxylesterase [Aureobasidium pullulans]THY94062.1 carboxylesterase [Aureobasidium pullulans]TIA15310.1 carboxylesterase [Aureobasidium pullulans]
MPITNHKKLNAQFTGVDLESCSQYRGIQYGTISKRFDLPTLKSDWDGEQVNCQRWGPRSPQNKYDIGHLLRAPEGDIFYDEAEDEFQCLNLDITIPADTPSDARLPVMIWIHGGSQIISFGNGASKAGDTTKLVAESAQHSRPMIVVSVQYRLNMFHVGDGNSNKNLGFKDQQLAVQWVHQYIAEFGGDPEEVTLAGESAGAVFVHGLIVGGAPLKRGILMSGSLHMSPPQPEARAKTMLIDPVLEKLRAKGYSSLEEAPVRALLEAQAEIPIPSVFLQEEDCFANWQEKTGGIQELIIGDCEFESVLWRNGVEAMTAEQIVECFNKAGPSGDRLKELYHINGLRAPQCRHGALDFLNDVRFASPVPLIAERYRAEGKKVYRYLFDQANPWQASSRAHHAVDLLYLFGGFDMTMNPSAEELGKELRRRLIWYINGDAPWTIHKSMAFGPLGETKEIDDRGVAARRRTRQMEEVKKLQASDVAAVFGSLAAGRISLHN